MCQIRRIDKHEVLAVSRHKRPIRSCCSDRSINQWLAIPATLFVKGSWIDANWPSSGSSPPSSLFEIANHGLSHRPCSVNGRSAYGIRGTGSVGELIDEIEKNGRKIEAATGSKKFTAPGRHIATMWP